MTGVQTCALPIYGISATFFPPRCTQMLWCGDLTISATSPHHSICLQRGSKKVADIPYEVMFQSSKNHAKVVFITAIYGNYEKTVKRFMRQTIPTDFICFTDNPNIRSNGWIIDSTPYHDLIQHPGKHHHHFYVGS